MRLSLTTQGVDYLSLCLEGGPGPEFCKITLGNGANAGSDAEEMSNPLRDISISEIARKDSYVELTGVLNNAEITERFKATEIGVYITDPYDTTETGVILFAYGYSPEEEATVIPAATDCIFETIEKVLVFVGKTEDVSAVLSESMLTASKAELQAHTGDIDNPHKVTAIQVGLGNVPNVATNDQTPTYAEAKTFETLSSGEKISTAFGKIKLAITNLISHIGNKENPHSVTAEQAGAAAKKHSHSTVDITSGTLTPERGGTGVTSYADLTNNLFEFGYYIGDGTGVRTIELSFTPKAVLLLDNQSGSTHDEDGVYGGLAIAGRNVITEDAATQWFTEWSDYYCILGIVPNGFKVNLYPNQKIYTNDTMHRYYYVAFR